MKANCISSANSTRHNFQVEHEGYTYDVVIWTDEKGKFMDEEIEWEGHELDGEGEEGEVREAITDYLANNWNDLVK
jgi:hypothetical protein